MFCYIIFSLNVLLYYFINSFNINFLVSLFREERGRRDVGVFSCVGADHVVDLLQSQKPWERRLCNPGNF